MSARLPTVATLAGLTHVGTNRQTNEDSFRVSEVGGPLTRGPEELVARLAVEGGLVFGVYDGAGGASSGNLASDASAKHVAESLARGAHPSGPAELGAMLVRAVTAAGKSLDAEATTNPKLRGMGTTATVAAVAGRHVAVAQVGDSRGYLLRGRELVQLTRDDTLVEQMLQEGRLSPEEAESFPHKNVLLQILGNGAALRVAVSTFEARYEDVLLVCTDGLHGLIGDDVLRAVMLRHHAPGVAARVLVDEALRAGGHDNIALVVARLDGGDLETGAAALEVLWAERSGG